MAKLIESKTEVTTLTLEVTPHELAQIVGTLGRRTGGHVWELYSDLSKIAEDHGIDHRTEYESATFSRRHADDAL